MQLLVPMAGRGSRFQMAGFPDPKPLIPIGGAKMYHIVLGNLINHQVSRVVIVCRQGLGLKVEAEKLSRIFDLPFECIELGATTGGAAETVATALPYLERDVPVVVANCDQFVAGNLEPYYSAVQDEQWSGVIMTMNSDDPKWSYAAVDASGRVLDVVEKKVISHSATTGIYSFSDVTLLEKLLGRMFQAGFRVNGEYYLAPVYNFLREEEPPATIFSLEEHSSTFYGLGTPADLEEFMRSPYVASAVHKAPRI